MRLIDADALYKDICDSINEMTKIGIMVDGEWLWAKLNDALENAPIIEPERKTGEWIDDYSTGGYYANCSECRCQIDVHENRGYPNFCPDCGADMRR